MTPVNNEEVVMAIFNLAQITVNRIWKLENGYVGELPPLSDPRCGHSNAESWMQDYRWRFE